uniref:Uncharacterized protein n=1 Tax=Ascaris lumbricoides TaxID=6252 RepID=A0A0M3HYU9_ASCLU
MGHSLVKQRHGEKQSCEDNLGYTSQSKEFIDELSIRQDRATCSAYLIVISTEQVIGRKRSTHGDYAGRRLRGEKENSGRKFAKKRS